MFWSHRSVRDAGDDKNGSGRFWRRVAYAAGAGAAVLGQFTSGRDAAEVIMRLLSWLWQLVLW